MTEPGSSPEAEPPAAERPAAEPPQGADTQSLRAEIAATRARLARTADAVAAALDGRAARRDPDGAGSRAGPEHQPEPDAEPDAEAAIEAAFEVVGPGEEPAAARGTDRTGTTDVEILGRDMGQRALVRTRTPPPPVLTRVFADRRRSTALAGGLVVVLWLVRRLVRR